MQFEGIPPFPLRCC